MDRFNIPLSEAMDLAVKEASALCSETVPLPDSLGRVLAADVIASHDVPHFDRSPFDGYAFRARDTTRASKDAPARLNIIEEIRAGDCPRASLEAGQAVKILTGAPIPPGADAVVKGEETEHTAAAVAIFEPFAPDSNIVYAGEDVRAGQIAAKAGDVIDPPLVGVFASLGLPRVDVIRRPNVALCVFGSELIEIQEPLLPGKIRNSNLYTFSAYLKEEGLRPLELGVAPDDTESVADAIKRGVARADVLVTTGGVSVGDYDLARPALQSLGAEILFWKMDIKPGSAILVSKLDGKLVLSLSGNPAAAVVGYKLIGVPYLRKIMGHADPMPARVKLKLLDPVKKPSPRTRILPGALKIVDGAACFQQYGVKGNGVLSSLIGCDLLGVIPAGTPPLPAGACIEAFCFSNVR